MKLLKQKLALISLAAVMSVSAHAASIWVSDSTNGSASFIHELDYDSGAVLATINGPGVFADALSFANDGQSIFVLDSSTDSDVYQIDLLGNILNSFSVSIDGEGLTVLADGTLLVGGGTSGVVATIDSLTGAVLSSFGVANNVFGLASDGQGTIYGLQINGIIDSFDLSGNLLGSLNSGVAGVTLGLGFTGTSFLISDISNDLITEVDLTGAFMRSIASPGPFTEGIDFAEGIQVPIEPTPVSAPVTLGLLGLGLIGLGRLSRRKHTA